MSLSLFGELVCFLDRFNDLVVTGAAAEVAHHPFFDLLLAGLGNLIQQGLGRYDLARSADPALKTAVLDEALLYGVELSVLCQSLDGRDLVAVGEYRQRKAGTDHLSIHQHGAGATDADTASLLDAGQP